MPDDGAPRRTALRLTLLSGGQTGVDRGALDAALALGVRCGGWCPEGRVAEDGVIPARYPLTPLPGADYAARTRRNVLDSDGTVILLFGPPVGGTKTTLECCLEHGKPHLLVDATRLFCAAAAERIAAFAASLPRGLLNMAGPRASQAPAAYGYAFETVCCLIRALEARGGSRPRGDQQSSGSGAPDVPSPAGGFAMDQFCHSCAAPLQVPGFAGPAAGYCRYCTDEEGKLKKKKQVRANIAHWMQSWQPDLDDKEALKRARRYMRSMPAWAP